MPAAGRIDHGFCQQNRRSTAAFRAQRHILNANLGLLGNASGQVVVAHESGETILIEYSNRDEFVQGFSLAA